MARTAAADGGADPAATIVVYVEGENASDVEQTIADQVPHTMAIAPRADFVQALGGSGWRGPMGNIIAVPGYRGPLMRAIRKAMKKVGAKYAILGRVRRTKTREQEVWILFVDGDETKLKIDRAVPIPKKNPDRFAALRGAIVPRLNEVAPPEAPPSPPPATEPPPKVAAPPSPPKPAVPPPASATARAPEHPPENERRRDVGSEIATLRAGYGIGGRQFAYSKPMTLNLRPYHVFGAQLVEAEGEVYPFAALRTPILDHLGIFAEYGIALGLQSAASTGSAVATTYDQLKGGVRARLRTGPSPFPIFGARAGVGWVRFQFDATSDLADELPSVWYKLVFGGLDARVPLGPVAIYAGADYLAPLDSGDLASRFRDPRVWGLAARAGVSVRIASPLEARLGGDYTTFFYSFGAKPADAYAASGAHDQLLVIELLVGLVY